MRRWGRLTATVASLLYVTGAFLFAASVISQASVFLPRAIAESQDLKSHTGDNATFYQCVGIHTIFEFAPCASDVYIDDFLKTFEELHCPSCTLPANTIDTNCSSTVVLQTNTVFWLESNSFTDLRNLIAKTADKFPGSQIRELRTLNFTSSRISLRDDAVSSTAALILSSPGVLYRGHRQGFTSLIAQMKVKLKLNQTWAYTILPFVRKEGTLSSFARLRTVLLEIAQLVSFRSNHADTIESPFVLDQFIGKGESLETDKFVQSITLENTTYQTLTY